MTQDSDVRPDDLSPDPAVLAHLAALVERLSLTTAARVGCLTESERHRLATGHRLRHGCCRVVRSGN